MSEILLQNLQAAEVEAEYQKYIRRSRAKDGNHQQAMNKFTDGCMV